MYYYFLVSNFRVVRTVYYIEFKKEMVESSTINLRRVLSELGNDTGSVENVS